MKTEGSVDGALIGWWYCNYWINSVLNWLVIPFLIEYLNAADFTISEKILRSIRNNTPYFLLYFIVFIVIVIILAVTESGREALSQ